MKRARSIVEAIDEMRGDALLTDEALEEWARKVSFSRRKLAAWFLLAERRQRRERYKEVRDE